MSLFGWLLSKTASQLIDLLVSCWRTPSFSLVRMGSGISSSVHRIQRSLCHLWCPVAGLQITGLWPLTWAFGEKRAVAMCLKNHGTPAVPSRMLWSVVCSSLPANLANLPIWRCEHVGAPTPGGYCHWILNSDEHMLFSPVAALAPLPQGPCPDVLLWSWKGATFAIPQRRFSFASRGWNQAVLRLWMCQSHW